VFRRRTALAFVLLFAASTDAATRVRRRLEDALAG